MERSFTQERKRSAFTFSIPWKVKKVLESDKDENIFNKFTNFESLLKLQLSTVSRQERGISGCYSIWDRAFLWQ